MSEQPKWMVAAMSATPALTAAGMERRENMGEMLRSAVASRRRRRLALRFGSAVGLATILAIVTWPARAEAEVAPGLRHIAFETVRDDPGILAAYGAPPTEVAPETWVDDQEILDLLKSAGRHTGLIRVQDRVTFTAEVTDDLPN